MNKLCVGVAAVGGAVLLLGLLWGVLFPPEQTWTVEKAGRMSELSRQAHTLHIQVNRVDRNPAAAGEEEPGEVHQKYREVTTELADLKQELESAKQSPKTISTWMRWTGLLLAVGGLVGLRALNSD